MNYTYIFAAVHILDGSLWIRVCVVIVISRYKCLNIFAETSERHSLRSWKILRILANLTVIAFVSLLSLYVIISMGTMQMNYANEWKMAGIFRTRSLRVTIRIVKDIMRTTFERLGELANSSIDVHSQAERGVDLRWECNRIEREKERPKVSFFFLRYMIYDER